jgi:hypothetical protein
MTGPLDVTYLVPADVLAEVNAAVTVLEPTARRSPKRCGSSTGRPRWRGTPTATGFPGSGTLTRSWSRRPPAAGQRGRPECAGPGMAAAHRYPALVACRAD